MKYAVDSIVDDIAVIEEIETGDKKEVSLEILPEEIQEGNILAYRDGEYYIDRQYDFMNKAFSPVITPIGAKNIVEWMNLHSIENSL